MKRKLSTVVVVLCALFIVLALAFEKKEVKPSTETVFAMDTYMTVSVYGDRNGEAIQKCTDEIFRLEGILDVNRDTSEVYLLNRDGEAAVSEDVVLMYQKALNVNAITDGAFDMTILPVKEAWGFNTKNYRVPENTELAELTKKVNMENIRYSAGSNVLSLDDGVKIDFGGIAKGYASDSLASILREQGIKSGLINLGGNVYALGAKPDGTPWNVGITDPENPEGIIGKIAVKDLAIVTSGAYERYFEKDGKIYHHIIDPKTGYPADSKIMSVTIVSGDGTYADALSTALFVEGLDRAIEIYKAGDLSFDFIIVTDEHKLYVTEGIKDIFTSDLDIVYVS